MIKTSAASIDIDAERLLEAETEWRAYHIFYGASPYTLLSDLVVPMADRVVASGLAKEYFFINYWLEGAHIRLRLRARPQDIKELDKQILTEGQKYLNEHPSMHPMMQLLDDSFYENLFEGEYTDAARATYFNAEGKPIFAENNTIQVRDYVREWNRYGGKIGMLLSERFFVDSSKKVIELLHLGNLRVRPMLLGIALQITFITAMCFLEDIDMVKDFFKVYHRRWMPAGNPPSYLSESGQSSYKGYIDELSPMLRSYAAAISSGKLSDLPEPLQDWAQTCLGYVVSLKELYAHGSLLEFDFYDGHRPAATVSESAWSLCHSFIHMTNNRMFVSVSDESFLSFLILQAFGENITSEGVKSGDK